MIDQLYLSFKAQNCQLLLLGLEYWALWVLGPKVRSSTWSPSVITYNRENSPLRKGSLYSWSPVWQGWIQLLHYLEKITYFLFWSYSVLLNWRPAIQWFFLQWQVFSVVGNDWRSASWWPILRPQDQRGPNPNGSKWCYWALKLKYNWLIIVSVLCLQTLSPHSIPSTSLTASTACCTLQL